MPTPTVQPLVDALVDARRRHVTLPSPPWAQSLHGADEAYAVQDGVAAALGWFGAAPPRHWKSGGASLAVPLTHAPLAPAGVRTSPAAFGDWPLHAPAIEGEIALRLAVEVDAARAAGLTQDDAHALVEAMTVSIEVVDSRWSERGDAPPLLRLADFGSHGALVLGDWVPYARRDWSAMRCELRIGAASPTQHTGTHSLGDPAAVLPQWLRHATRGGAKVPAGTVVTTGTWVGVQPARRGDTVVLGFDGIGQASLKL